MQAKVKFLLRISAWLCLVPASIDLFFYQMLQNSARYLFLIEIMIAAIFATYLLVEVKNDDLKTAKKVLAAAVFSLVFVSVIVFIPLLAAYLSLKNNENS